MQITQSTIPSAVLNYIKGRYPDGQDLQLKTDPIYSTVRFSGVVAANVLTTDTASRVAFSYALNGDMGPAGRAAVTATQADTNLQSPGQTRDQADVFIYGLSAYIAGGDPGMAQELFREIDVFLSTNGSVSSPIGTLDMYPAAGGLYGEGNSSLITPNFADAGFIDGGQGGLKKFFTNGMPTANSYRRLDVPIFWAGLGNGPDSSLAITCTPRRAITKTLVASRVAAAGIQINSQATTATSFLDVRWVLHNVQVQRRSVNAG
jgi:hypothetical protein